MRSRVLIAVLLLGLGAFGGACVYSRQKDKSLQSDFVDISRLPAGSEYDRMNNILYRVTDASKVKGAIDEIVGIAETERNNDTAQVYAAILKPMRNMQGIIYRMRFMVERVDVAYIQSISALRAFKRNNTRRAKHIDAFFDYFTQPNLGQDIGGQKGPFGSVAQFQDWMVGTVAKDIKDSLAKLNTVAVKYKGRPSQEVFMYDIALLIGPTDASGADKAASKTRRLRKVSAGDLYVLIADMEERMGIGHYLASYDLEDLPRFMNALTKKTLLAKEAKFILPGQNAFKLHLQSPLEVHEELFRKVDAGDELKAVLKARPGSRLKALASKVGERFRDERAYADFLTLREVGRHAYLASAKEHILNAIVARTEAMKLMTSNAPGAGRQDFFLDPDLYSSRPGFTINILNKRKGELEKAEEFVDRVTGESFPLNVTAMFDVKKIPQDPTLPGIHDLKSFFPKHFVDQEKKVAPFFGEETDKKDSQRFAWNYEYGKPDQWPDPTFGGVLPGATDANFPDRMASLARDASTRVLQAWLRVFML